MCCTFGPGACPDERDTLKRKEKPKPATIPRSKAYRALAEAHWRYENSQSPPDVLYHYTRHEGLIGIASSKHIWASDLRYLNDREELEHGLQILEAAIHRARIAGQLDGSHEPFDWNEMYDLRGPGGPGGIFAACFSARPDDLNQWRAYCPAGGYCLGFDAKLFERAIGDDGSLVRVMYGDEEKNSFADSLVRIALREWRRTKKLLRKEREREQEYLREGIEDVFLSVASMMKHRSFASEEEWRFIAGGHLSDSSLVRYRAGLSTVVPYISIPLFPPRARPKMPIAIAGPNPNADLATFAMTSCLEDAGIDVEMRDSSGLPYRHW